MKEQDPEAGTFGRLRLSRRDTIKAAIWLSVFGVPAGWARAASAEETPEEPENLDEPTQWQEGDPEPVEATIPAEEPEQTSQDAPPSQPMDDDRGEAPGEEYAWATGYWWWHNGGYAWVPGYWVTPPEANLIWVSGYWTYQSTAWVYVQGGWGRPNTTVVVVKPRPRPLLTAFIITAPLRIIRRNRRWRHHHHRRGRHRARRSPGRGPSKGPSRGPSKGPSKGPKKGPSKGPKKGPRKGPKKGSKGPGGAGPGRR